MLRDRFIVLLKQWHFANNENDDGGNVQLLHNQKKNQLLMKVWYLGERDSFCQWITQKSHQYGIKLHKLYVPSGYIKFCAFHKNLIIYYGKTPELTNNIGHAHKVTIDIIEGLLHKGRLFYRDNFYRSSPLVQELLERKRIYCSMLKGNIANL